MTKLVAVVGITGKQGGSVADTFLADGGWTVRGLTRDPESRSAAPWRAKGVELVRADLDDVASLEAAFAGAHVIFAVTDFWGPVFTGALAQTAREQGIPLNVAAHDLEVRRGKNLARAAARVGAAAPGAVLERYVYSSLSETLKWSHQKYRNNLHFDGKAEVASWIRTATDPPELAALAAKTSFVQVGLYLDNWRGDFQQRRKKDEPVVRADFAQDPATGAYVHRGLGTGHEKVPFVWTRRDTGPYVLALARAPPGKTVLACTQEISWRQFMHIWADTLGVALVDGDGFQSITRAEARDRIQSPGMQDEIADSMAYIAEFGYDGGDPSVLRAKDLGIEDQLTSIEQYVKEEDWSSLFG